MNCWYLPVGDGLLGLPPMDIQDFWGNQFDSQGTRRMGKGTTESLKTKNRLQEQCRLTISVLLL
jgi:hypothetical protein